MLFCEGIRYSHNGESPVAVGTRLVCEKAGCDERSRLLDGVSKSHEQRYARTTSIKKKLTGIGKAILVR